MPNGSDGRRSTGSMKSLNNSLKAMAARKQALLTNVPNAKRALVLTQAAVAQNPTAALQITDSQGTPLHQLPTFQNGRLHAVVGERIRLRVRIDPASPSTGGMTGVHWTVGRDTVRRCVQMPAQGTADPLTPGDLASTDLDFFWITGGRKDVQVSATVDGRQVYATATVEVLAPQVRYCTLTTSRVTVCAPDDYLHPGSWIALYEHSPERYGCSWSAELTLPFQQIGNRVLGAGEAGFIQVSGFTITTFDYTDLDHVNVTTSVTAGPGPIALDSDAGTMTYGPSKSAGAAGVITFGPDDITYSDSPGSMLESGLRQITRTDEHRLHLVYRPATADGIWVTLCRGDWNWHAQITRTDLVTLNSPWAAPQSSVNPSPYQQTDLPASHEPPTWRTRTDTIVAAGPQRHPL